MYYLIKKYDDLEKTTSWECEHSAPNAEYGCPIDDVIMYHTVHKSQASSYPMHKINLSYDLCDRLNRGSYHHFSWSVVIEDDGLIDRLVNL